MCPRSTAGSLRSPAVLSTYLFSPRIEDWFERAFEGPTPAQELGWPAIARVARSHPGADRVEEDAAAFLLGIDRLNETPGEGQRLLYVSPLKALNYDIERNLRGPLAGVESSSRSPSARGRTPPPRSAAGCCGHRPHPHHDPESLFLLLTSQARETLRGIEDRDPGRGACGRGNQAGRTWRCRSSGWSASRTPFQRVGLSAAAADGRDRALRRRARARSSSWTRVLRKEWTS